MLYDGGQGSQQGAHEGAQEGGQQGAQEGAQEVPQEEPQQDPDWVEKVCPFTHSTCWPGGQHEQQLAQQELSQPMLLLRRVEWRLKSKRKAGLLGGWERLCRSFEGGWWPSSDRKHGCTQQSHHKWGARGGPPQVDMPSCRGLCHVWQQTLAAPDGQHHDSAEPLPHAHTVPLRVSTGVGHRGIL